MDIELSIVENQELLQRQNCIFRRLFFRQAAGRFAPERTGSRPQPPG
ncbi:MAG: hypothetical protein NTX42_05615 [Methanothrix sp.]|nr:hypothetical protein [Methanothrix sp.]